MATTPPPAPGSAPPAKKKSNVVLWVIGGVFAFFLLIGMAAVGGAFFLWNKVQDVTSDMEGNPALAITKLISTLNPDLEIISVDESNNTIKIRQKSSNKTIELDLDRIKEGNLSAVFEGEEGPETFEFNTDEAGSVEMKSGNRTVKIGPKASGEIPDWVPRPPGVTLKSLMSSQTGTGSMGAFSYPSKQPAKEILDFYEKESATSGLHPKNRNVRPRMASLVLEGGGKSLQIFFTTPADGAEGTVTVTYTEKSQ